MGSYALLDAAIRALIAILDIQLLGFIVSLVRGRM